MVVRRGPTFTQTRTALNSTKHHLQQPSTMEPREVAELLKLHGSGNAVNAEESSEPSVVSKQRTDALQGVLKSCNEALVSNNGRLEQIADKLANGSRDGI